MLGEGLTTGAQVQFMKFDEGQYDPPRRRRKRAGVVAMLVALLAAIALVA